MVGTDIYPVTQLRKNATISFSTESGDKLNQELNGFLTQFTLMDTKTKKNFFQSAPFHYWPRYGCIDFPMLAEIAIRVRNTPLSSAASKRAWSSFDFIHTKRRNRLLNEKVRKLVFIYTSYPELDPKDDNDYLSHNFDSDLE